MIAKINFMEIGIRHYFILMVLALLYGCAADQFKEESTANCSSPPIPYKIDGFHHCPLSEADIDLLIAIEKGVVEPNVSVNNSGRVALSPQDMNMWRAAQKSLEGYFPPLVVDKNSAKPVFVAIFDGTWNDRDDLHSPLTIPAKLSYELENLSKNDKQILVKYYHGVGARVSSFRAVLDGISGEGTVDRAEIALRDYQEAAKAFNEIPNVYAIGFSRGAASARHFLNLVDPILSMPSGLSDLNLIRSRSFALLFDTVATGQLNSLNLDIPGSTMSTLHLVATQERRINFPYVTALNDVDKDADSNTVIELKLPGAHSNLGGGYGSGLEIISLEIAKKWLIEQGFSLSLSETDALTVMNEGRHDSDGMFTSLADGLLSVFGKGERRRIEPVNVNNNRKLTTEQNITLLLEKSILVTKSAKASLERLLAKKNSGEYVQKKFLSLQFSRSDDVLIIDTNCPEYISLNPRRKMLLLKDFGFFSVRDIYQELESIPGVVQIIEAENPENFRNVHL